MEQTRLDGWKILFMSEVQDAGPILKRLLDAAREFQNRESAQNPSADDLNRLLYEADFKEGERPRWVNVQEWARQAHAKARENQFKAAAFEIYRLAYTVGQAGEWLGRTFTIKESDAVALMSLDYDPQQVDAQDLKSWRIQAPTLPQGDSIVGITAVELKALFPIVRKIVVRATLPREIAKPFREAGLELRLVDCPGAALTQPTFPYFPSDTVVCSHELKDVDAVLALLNAKNPGESRQFHRLTVAGSGGPRRRNGSWPSSAGSTYCPTTRTSPPGCVTHWPTVPGP